MADETPSDEQVREWFPKLFADIDAELEELDACEVCKGVPGARLSHPRWVLMALRCGCENSGDDGVFGPNHRCVVDPTLKPTTEAVSSFGHLVPSWRFVVPETSEGVAADNLQQELDRLEPRYLETLDADERGGH